MNQELNSTKWYVAYDLLANSLFEFFLNCKKSKTKPSTELYEILANDAGFKNNNAWIDKFKKEFGVKSLDPIHVFASFNGSKSSDIIREGKILYLLGLLKVKHNIKKIVTNQFQNSMLLTIYLALSTVCR